MWSIFKDENEYNEKAIIGFISFALMCVFGIVDLVMGIIGIELMVNDYTKNPSELSGSMIQVHQDSPFLEKRKKIK